MPRRLAILLVLLACLAPSAVRVATRSRPVGRDCTPEGRGIPPAHWIGCRGDPGIARPLTGTELVLVGRRVDPNVASADDLAAVPGLSPALAREVVADRGERGRFEDVDDLLRVRGIGPARLARARDHLVVNGP